METKLSCLEEIEVDPLSAVMKSIEISIREEWGQQCAELESQYKDEFEALKKRFDEQILALDLEFDQKKNQKLAELQYNRGVQRHAVRSSPTANPTEIDQCESTEISLTTGNVAIAISDGANAEATVFSSESNNVAPSPTISASLAIAEDTNIGSERLSVNNPEASIGTGENEPIAITQSQRAAVEERDSLIDLTSEDGCQLIVSTGAKRRISAKAKSARKRVRGETHMIAHRSMMANQMATDVVALQKRVNAEWRLIRPTPIATNSPEQSFNLVGRRVSITKQHLLGCIQSYDDIRDKFEVDLDEGKGLVFCRPGKLRLIPQRESVCVYCGKGHIGDIDIGLCDGCDCEVHASCLPQTSPKPDFVNREALWFCELCIRDHLTDKH